MSNLPDDLEGELVARNRRQALFEEIWDQMYRLHTNWRLWVTLFGDRNAVDVLIKSAWVTFGAIQYLVHDEIILGIQRLLNPRSGKRGRSAASMESLLALMAPADAALRRRLSRDLDQLRRDCVDISKWRHRRIAHRDLSTALEASGTPGTYQDPNDLDGAERTLHDVGHVRLSESASATLSVAPPQAAS